MRTEHGAINEAVYVHSVDKESEMINETKDIGMKPGTSDSSELPVDQTVDADYSVKVEDHTDNHINIKPDSERVVDSIYNDSETMNIVGDNLEREENDEMDMEKKQFDIKPVNGHFAKSVEGSTSAEKESENNSAIHEIETKFTRKHRHHHSATGASTDNAIKSDPQDSSEINNILENGFLPPVGGNSENLETGTTTSILPESEDSSNKLDKESSSEASVHEQSSNKQSSEDGKQTVPNKNFDLSSLPNFNDLPPLPSNKELPSLPNIEDLPPLPNLDELPPINSAELNKLPALNKLNSLGNLPPVQRNGPVPNIHNAKSETFSGSVLHPSDHSTVQSTEFRDNADLKDSGITSDTLTEANSKQYSKTLYQGETEKQTENLPQSDIPDGDNWPVTGEKLQTEINIEENVDKRYKTEVNINMSKNDKQNVSLGESDLLLMSGLPETGPVLPRVQTDSRHDDFKWMPLDWSEVNIYQ